MAEKVFTAKTAENCKPADKPYKKSTGRGFYLYVAPGGSRTWRFDYRWYGKRKTVTYGQFPAITLAEATNMHEEFKSALARGTDSLAEKKKMREKAKDVAEQEREEIIEQERTFDRIAADWLSVWSAERAESTVAEKKRFLGYLSNTIGQKPITETKAADILEMARLLEADGYGESAHRIIMAANQVLDHAVILGFIDANPA